MMRNKIIIAVMLLSAFVLALLSAEVCSAQDNDVHLHVFYGQGCPHCGSLHSFLDEIQPKYPTLDVSYHEVYFDEQERVLFEQMSRNFNVGIEGVPTVFIDDKVIVGFSNAIGASIENEVQRCLYEECGDPSAPKPAPGTAGPAPDIVHVVGESSPSEDPGKTEFSQRLTIPIVLSAAAVDAINPCAFAVLIILMTAALAIAERKKALKFGIAFAAAIYISYFLMGLGLFSALQAAGISRTFYIIVTVLAVIVGLLNIKDYFWYGKGFLMEVPLSWRPTMKKILNSATSPFGAFIAGFAVSLFELPCTGGPYIVILGLLAKEVTRNVGILYLLLYNLVFISPLIILTIVIYKGISTTAALEQIRQKRIRVLHLIAGLLMLGIAAAMVLSIIYGWV